MATTTTGMNHIGYQNLIFFNLQTLTPLLLTRIGKREWSVYELTRFLSVGSQTEDSMYNPISMRRRAPVINLPQAVIAETENVTTLFKEPEKIEESDNLLVEETTVKEYKEHKIEEISVENETNEQLDGKASASAAVVEGKFAIIQSFALIL